jgi:rod shape-determining protein MreC
VAIRQRPRSTRLLVVVLVSISLAVITLDYRQRDSGPLAVAGDAAKAFLAPMQRAVTAVTEPVGDFFSGLAHLPSLANENARLREENAALVAERQVIAAQRQDYEQLQDLLGLRGALDPTAVPAHVIANPVSNFEYTVTIDKGSSDGIEPWQPVATGSADAPMLVGRIVSVTPVSSVVLLLIDREHKTPATIGDTGEAGLIEGQGASDLRMTLVRSGTLVEGGDPVFTQGYRLVGQEGLYPPDMLIGEVSRLVPSENETQQFVEVRPAVDFETLQFVLVLRSRSEG